LYFHQNLPGHIGWIKDGSIPALLPFHYLIGGGEVGYVQAALYHPFKKGMDTFYFPNPLVGGNYETSP